MNPPSRQQIRKKNQPPVFSTDKRIQIFDAKQERHIAEELLRTSYSRHRPMDEWMNLQKFANEWPWIFRKNENKWERISFRIFFASCCQQSSRMFPETIQFSMVRAKLFKPRQRDSSRRFAVVIKILYSPRSRRIVLEELWIMLNSVERVMLVWLGERAITRKRSWLKGKTRPAAQQESTIQSALNKPLSAQATLAHIIAEIEYHCRGLMVGNGPSGLPNPTPYGSWSLKKEARPQQRNIQWPFFQTEITTDWKQQRQSKATWYLVWSQHCRTSSWVAMIAHTVFQFYCVCRELYSIEMHFHIFQIVHHRQAN